MKPPHRKRGAVFIIMWVKNNTTPVRYVSLWYQCAKTQNDNVQIAPQENIHYLKEKATWSNPSQAGDLTIKTNPFG